MLANGYLKNQSNREIARTNERTIGGHYGSVQFNFILLKIN